MRIEKLDLAAAANPDEGERSVSPQTNGGGGIILFPRSSTHQLPAKPNTVSGEVLSD